VSTETEKITLNLSVVELAQIDVLIDQGIYANRSDFIRAAIRKNIEMNRDTIEQALTPIATKKSITTIIGIQKISKKNLESLARNQETLKLSIIGMLVVDNDITTELFEQTVEYVFIRGKLLASPEIKAIIDNMN